MAHRAPVSRRSGPLTGLALAAHSAKASCIPGTKASHATTLGADLPEWVQLLPAGTFAGIDGRGPYHLSDPNAVIHLSGEMAVGDLPIDYGHALEVEGPEGDAAPAAGWITALEERGGEIWGRVEWTDEGARRIRGREYRFLSPVFFHDDQGTVQVITRAGLTNRPNLRLKSINTQSAPGGKETTLDPELSQLAVALGLSEDATAEEVLAAIVALRVAAEAVPAAQSSGPEETQVDPAQYVPREQYDELAALLKASQSREGERLVGAAIMAGKLIPAQRAWALSYHALEPEGFAEFLAKQPVVVRPGRELTPKAPAPGTTESVDAGTKAICATLGISTADFTKNLGGE